MVGVLLLAGATAACGAPSNRGTASGGITSAAATKAPGPAPSPTTSALAMGRKFTDPTTGVAATVYAYQQPVATSAPKPEQAGYEWAAIDAETCITKPLPTPATVSWRPWSLVYADHTVSEANGFADPRFPKPEYPYDDRAVPVGRCVRGWIVFPALANKRPVMIERQVGMAPDPIVVTDWAV